MLYAVRPMELADIPRVTEVERECFPSPWESTNFRRELSTNTTSRYLVAYMPRRGEDDPAADSGPSTVWQESRVGRFKSQLRRLLSSQEPPSPEQELIVGYTSLWFMANEAHITAIGIGNDYRRQGIGELLLIASIELAAEQNAHFLSLEVRESNHVAQALYKKYGFAPRGIRRGYYTDNREDAVVMATDHIASTSFQANFQRLKRIHAARWGQASPLCSGG